jgi:signal transduction histidine kinase
MSGPSRTELTSQRWIRRLWPQKVRTRLTVTYAALFLAGGCALLGLTYGLVAASLPAHSTASAKPVLSASQYFQLCKNHAPGKRGTPAKPGGSRVLPGKPAAMPAKVAHLCEQAYLQGQTSGSSQQRERALHSLLLFSALGLGIMTLASAGAGWIVAGRVLRPVRVITETARRASEQHLGERIALSGARDELKELADTFDGMLERLDRAFSSQRRFVADASHELRTPLTVMRTAIDVTLAKPGRTPEQLESMAIRVRNSIDRAEAMTDALLTLAISDQGTVSSNEPFDLATAAQDAVDVAMDEIERLDLRVHADLDAAETTGDPHLLDRMISNLVGNAVRHNAPGGDVMLTSGVRDGMAFLQVSNTGPKVTDDVIPSLFEPFRRLEGRTGRTDRPGGAGLGLAIARSVAAAHGTTVLASSRPAGGIDVEVALPARPASDPR